jgi:hypothetical protein
MYFYLSTFLILKERKDISEIILLLVPQCIDLYLRLSTLPISEDYDITWLCVCVSVCLSICLCISHLIFRPMRQ